jgi:hypothetical protein
LLLALGVVFCLRRRKQQQRAQSVLEGGTAGAVRKSRVSGPDAVQEGTSGAADGVSRKDKGDAAGSTEPHRWVCQWLFNIMRPWLPVLWV